MSPPTFEEELDELGYSPTQIAEVAQLLRVEAQRMARVETCEFIARMLVRLDINGVHGRALAAACGFTRGVALEMAAAEFGVSKQYLHQIQNQVEQKLGEIAAELKVAS